MDKLVNSAASFIKKMGNGVVLTGSGISSESGIATYRDKGGLWDKYKEGSTGGIFTVLANHPDEASDILSGFFESLYHGKPNPGHVGIAELEKEGFINSVITQNIDGLHYDAGSSNIYELHGNIFRLKCMNCSKKTSLSKQQFYKMGNKIVDHLTKYSFESIFDVLPKCSCKGVMRPDFVSFGEPVPDILEAVKEAKSCKFMMIVGTSGVVYPAASLPQHAKSGGAYIIEINMEESALTKQADIFIQGKAGEVIPKLIEKVREKSI